MKRLSGSARSVGAVREPARLWARARWRHSGRSLAALGVVVGLGSAVVLVAVAGARRTATSYDRLVAATDRYDLAIQDDSEGEPTVRAVSKLPGVAVADRVTLVFGSVGGQQLILVAGRSGRLGYDIDRPVVVKGRLPAPSADDEIMLNETSAQQLGLRVGRTITVDTFTRDQFEAAVFGSAGSETAPSGPKLKARVVGIGRLPDDLDDPQPAALAPPAVLRRLGPDVGAFDNLAKVRLTSPADRAGFLAAMRALPGHRADSVYVSDATQNEDRVGDALTVERLALVAFALAAGLAVAVAGAQAVARQLGGAEGDQQVLASLGLTRPARAAVVLAPIAPTVTMAALVAMVGAVAASPILPLGLARRAEPDPGWHADLAVLLPGALTTAIVLLAAAALAAWRISGSGTPSDARDSASRRPSKLTAMAAGAGLAPTALTGIRMALEAGRGRTAVPVRPAWGAAVAGVAGVVAVGLFGASLSRLLTEPALYGTTWDASINLSDDPAEAGAQTREVQGEPRIASISVADSRQVEIEGSDVDMATIDPIKGSGLFAPLLDGRLPAGQDEVALGAITARELGAALGDEVRAAGEGGRTVPLRVVGIIVVTDGRGGTVTAGGLTRLARSDGFRRLLVSWKPGVDPEPVAAALGEKHDFELETPPSAVDNLAQARGLPRLLAAFLAVVGLAAVLHALGVTVRRRSRDFAVLRALGFRRAQVVRAISWQATTLVAIGLVLGLPLGVAAGRTAWQVLARSLGVVDHPAPAAALVAAAAGGGILIVNLLALPAAVAAGRRATAAALRSE